MANERIEIPIIIGGKEIRTGETAQSVMPHDHRHVLADWHKASTQARASRRSTPRATRAPSGRNWAWEDRAAVFLKAAELLATTWRQTLNASTMLGQSKTAFQAEIDAACELIDFWRFNPAYAQELYDEQPLSNNTMWNQLDYRPLEGFVYAVTPFNFTSIGGNLPTAPALMGNTVIWKPASSAMLSAYYLMRLLEEAGLPPGVINFVPGDAAEISNMLLSHRELAGVHFTGSTGVFNSMWKTIGANMSQYATYPRIVGETGGKDFIVAHPSADPQALAVAIARGGFEYQGQKCSAASRVYIPRSLWNDVRDRTVAMMEDMRMGDITDFRNFVGAVIDEKAFKKISEYLDDAQHERDDHLRRRRDGRRGLLHQADARRGEGSGLSPAVRGDLRPGRHGVRLRRRASGSETLEVIDTTSPYALTGAVFANDRARGARGDDGAAQRGGQFLRQRQADRRGGRTAAVRRRARVGHERQGGLEAQPRALGERAVDQGDVLAAARLQVSVHGGGVGTRC